MEHVTEQQLTRRQSTVWRALRAAAPQTLPVLAGYFVLGMGYGIYVQSLGLPVWMPMLMGTVVYGGSLEFVLASLLLSAFSPLSAFLMALMIQARHLFYGLAMLERYKGYGLRSFLYDLCHERRDLFHHLLGRAAGRGGQGLVHVLHYPAGSVLLGGQCRSWRGGGLGAAFQHRGCGFCHDRNVHGHLPEPVGKRSAARQCPDRACRPIGVSGVFGSSSFLLPSMGCILVLLLALRKPIEKAEGTEAEKSGEEVGA